MRLPNATSQSESRAETVSLPDCDSTNCYHAGHGHGDLKLTLASMALGRSLRRRSLSLWNIPGLKLIKKYKKLWWKEELYSFSQDWPAYSFS